MILSFKEIDIPFKLINKVNISYTDSFVFTRLFIKLCFFDPFDNFPDCRFAKLKVCFYHSKSKIVIFQKMKSYNFCDNAVICYFF
jgi:hypothetical protein